MSLKMNKFESPGVSDPSFIPEINEEAIIQDNTEDKDAETSPSQNLKFLDKYRVSKGAKLLLFFKLTISMSAYLCMFIFTIFMTSIMKYTASTATFIYHVVSAITYVSNVFGALIADGLVGRIQTFLIFYPINTILTAGMVVCSIFQSYTVLVVLIFISAICLGLCGSCIRAFAADQIDQNDKMMLNAYFHMIYLISNIGVILVGLVGPIIHKDIYCFGNECYALNFGISTILGIVTIFILVFGMVYKLFVLQSLTKNILSETISCIWFSLKLRIKYGKPYFGHWMDYSDSMYDPQLVYDCKTLLGLCFLLLGHPIFYIIFQQMASIWTLQARYMDGMVTNSFILQADQIQSLHPIFVVILIPIFELVVYPYLDKISFKVPFRIALGQFFTAASCAFMILIQYMINQSLKSPLKSNDIHVKIINLNPFPVSIQNSLQIKIVPAYETTDMLFDSANRVLTVTLGGISFNTQIDSPGGKYVSGVIYFPNTTRIISYFSEIQFQDDGGYSQVRLIDVLDLVTNEKIIFRANYGINKNFLIAKSGQSFGSYVKCGLGSFDIIVKSSMGEKKMKTIILQSAQSVLVYLGRGTVGLELFTMDEYRIAFPKIFWQFIPYLLLSIGDVFFSVNTGVFLYNEAPLSIKSVILSVEYLCIAIGDVFIIILNGILMRFNMIYFFIVSCVFVFVSGLVTQFLIVIYLEDKIIREKSLSEKASSQNPT